MSFNNYNRLSKLVKYTVLLAPLVCASLVAYPTLFVCCMVNKPGSLTTRVLDLSPYQIKGVELRYAGNLIIKKGNENSLILGTSHNIIDYFEPRIEGTTLILDKKPGSLRLPHSPFYTLIIPTDIHSLLVNGSGRVVIDELNVDTFSCSIKGSGKATILKGIINQQKIEICGSGKYLAPHLLGIITCANIRGSGKASVQVRDTLKVHINGSGKCAYSGDPKISMCINGAGKIVHEN